VRRSTEADSQFLQTTTVSLGIASMQGEQIKPQELVEKADRALYQAKQQGRNRAVVYEDWMLNAAHLPVHEDPYNS
jgi:diguanylate cyclase (GGDEF)-like protein